MKIAIGFVVYITNQLHLDFTLRTIDSVKTSYPHEKMVFLNKIGESRYFGFFNRYIQVPRQNRETACVAKGWNELIKFGLNGGAEYVIIPNTDIVFHPKCIDNLIKFAEGYKEFILWTASEWPDLRTINEAQLGAEFDEHPHFSCFCVNKDTIDKVGYFDEKFEAGYCEDLDYHLRILLTGEKAAKTASALFYHFKSRTIACDENLKRQNLLTHERNRQYFTKKWGTPSNGHGAHQLFEMVKCHVKKEIF